MRSVHPRAVVSTSVERSAISPRTAPHVATKLRAYVRTTVATRVVTVAVAVSLYPCRAAALHACPPLRMGPVHTRTRTSMRDPGTPETDAVSVGAPSMRIWFRIAVRVPVLVTLCCSVYAAPQEIPTHGYLYSYTGPTRRSCGVKCSVPTTPPA